jgi:tRNA-dihydrouridine synthase
VVFQLRRQPANTHAGVKVGQVKDETRSQYRDDVRGVQTRIQIPIFGNGDIDSPEKAKMYKERFGVDGVMIGRSAIGYPWIFNEIKHYVQTGAQLPKPTIAERVAVTNKHLEFSIRWKGAKLGVLEMRRHYASYFKSIPDFKPFRARLVEANQFEDVQLILHEVLENYAEMELIPC